MRFHISAFASAFEANDQETHCTFLAGFALRFRLMIFAAAHPTRSLLPCRSIFHSFMLKPLMFAGFLRKK